MKVIEFIRYDKSFDYSITLKSFKSFKKFLEYATSMQSKCVKNDYHCNYYELRTCYLIKILYISNIGLFCTL